MLFSISLVGLLSGLRCRMATAVIAIGSAAYPATLAACVGATWFHLESDGSYLCLRWKMPASNEAGCCVLQIEASSGLKVTRWLYSNKLFVWNWQEEGSWYVHVMDCVRDSRGCHGLQHICCGRISCGKAAGKQIKSNSPASWLHLSWFMFGCWGFLSTAQMIPCKWLFTCFLPGISISSLPNSYNSCNIDKNSYVTKTVNSTSSK